MQHVVTLKHPIIFEGREVTEIHLDFSTINGSVLARVEAQMMRENKPILSGQFSPTYCAYCAALAGNVPIDLINQLLGPDYMEVATRAQGFLLGISETETETETVTRIEPEGSAVK
jgi:hypothetical protein